MAEFKKLSEVEQIESVSDNATVLVEEGGEIKRVPKTAVGGAGGYVIKLENAYYGSDDAFWFDESYDELYDVLMAGGSVWVDYTNAGNAGGGGKAMVMAAPSEGWQTNTNMGAEHVPVMMWFLTDVGLVITDVFGMMNDTPNIYYRNGSHNLEPNEAPAS